jgi:serine-protein kinase ATM
MQRFVLYSRTCEITLELMRRYADTLITIVEVFLYDPLYQWQLSPQKALQLQQQFEKTNGDGNATANVRRTTNKTTTTTTTSSSSSSSPSPSPSPFPSTLSLADESSSIGAFAHELRPFYGHMFDLDTNKMAERLLLGLRQKLQGVEQLNQMTIKAHVNMLIQEATNIDHLSQLFAGWQAYL